jgi:poly(hydroxyalkanoate) granule-associated protein
MAKRLKKAASTAKSSSMGNNAMGQLGEKLGEKVAAIASSLSEQPNAKQVMESAQQIWLAGLGAFSKAQAEGKKAFELLVKQGETLEKHTRTVAEATIETAKEQATKTLGMASGKFDKLEQVFEDRVHKSLNRLGVLTSKDVEALSGQVAELADAVRALLAAEKKSPARAAATATTRAAATVKKTIKKAVKPVAKKVTKVAKKAVRKTKA